MLKNKIAKNKNALRKRVARFFEYGNPNRNEVRRLIEALTSSTTVYVFGGMLRDICLEGIRGFKSDIDLVFDGNRRELENILIRYSFTDVKINKFGGYRIRQESWDVDIWCLEDTWAFKEGFVIKKDSKSLFQTTLLTWDAAIYDIKANKLEVSSIFFEHLLKGKIDVVLSITPNEIGATVRIFRAIYAKNARILGINAAKILLATLTKYDDSKIIEYEKSSYSLPVISAKKIENIRLILKDFDYKSDIFLNDDEQYLLDV